MFTPMLLPDLALAMVRSFRERGHFTITAARRNPPSIGDRRKRNHVRVAIKSLLPRGLSLGFHKEHLYFWRARQGSNCFQNGNSSSRRLAHSSAHTGVLQSRCYHCCRWVAVAYADFEYTTSYQFLSAMDTNAPKSRCFWYNVHDEKSTDNSFRRSARR